MSIQQELNQRRLDSTPRGVGLTTQIFIESANNAEIRDMDGRRYIDFAAGIAVLNTGHLHPKVKAAVAAQLDQFTHTCFQVFPYAGYVELAETLNNIVPISGPKKTLFVTTGAEAVENAIKVARAATGRSGVIAFSGGFHGRTLLGMALTGKTKPYKAGFGAMPAEIFHAPFPNNLHGVTVEVAITCLKELFKSSIDPARVAAIIIEPVQGEGGFNVAPPAFFKALRQVCDEHGILLIVDEIQTGFARTGKMFAIEHSGVEPDLMTMAKSLAGGFPLAAVTGRAELMDAPDPGGLGGTYAGNPLAIAAALAVQEVIAEENLCERASAVGERLMNHLKALQQEIPQIADVRGLGAMVAAEFMSNGQPDADFAKRVQAKALEGGLVLLTCGSYGNVIRFLMPLTIEDAVMDEALSILDTALRSA